MRIKHTSKFRQKMLSFFLGLSLLFNIFVPVTTVLADSLTGYTIEYYAVLDGVPYQYGGELTRYSEIHPLGYGTNQGSTATAPPGYVFNYWSSDLEGMSIVSREYAYIPDAHEDASYYAHFIPIAQKTIKVKPVDKQMVYDGNPYYATDYEIVEGDFDDWDDAYFDDMWINYGGSITNVGTEQSYILGGLELRGKDAWKYHLEFLPGELMVTRRDATITVDDTSKIYGDPDPIFTFSSSGFFSGDEPDLSDYYIILVEQ